jgi:hypothetical protein
LALILAGPEILSHPFVLTHSKHITNLIQYRNRTIDYLTAPKPEAYQAHYRRISAAKAADKSNEDQRVSEEQQEQIQQQQADAQGLHADLEARLQIDSREYQFTRPRQPPHSAPATFDVTSGKTTVPQGNIPIGITPSLSQDTGC